MKEGFLGGCWGMRRCLKIKLSGFVFLFSKSDMLKKCGETCPERILGG